MKEDADKTHTRHAPQNLAILRNTALNIVNLTSARSATPTERWERTSANVWRKLAYIGEPQAA